ncbi:hypothetical protein MTO96_018269 [Rhipicephalus appendiculatus]
MPRRGRKCHSAHKYGSKNGNNTPRTPAAVAENDTVATAVLDSDVEDSAESRQRCNGLDKDASSDDTDRKQQQPDEKVAGSSSSPDSPRSSEGNLSISLEIEDQNSGYISQWNHN